MFISAIGDGSDVADQDIQGLLNDTGKKYNYFLTHFLNYRKITSNNSLISLIDSFGVFFCLLDDILTNYIIAISECTH